DCGSERGEDPRGGDVLRLIQIRLTTPSLQEISPVCQANLQDARIAASSSRNAVSFSSARTIKRPSVLSLYGHNPKSSTLDIRTWDTAAAPTDFAKIVGDDFPVLHPLQYAVTDCSQPFAARVSSIQAVRSLSAVWR